MMNWKIAAVQMDCQIGAKSQNLDAILARLEQAAAAGAHLAVFPECILSGYCFGSKEEAWPHAEPLPGPSSEALVAACKKHRIFAVVGMLESRAEDHALFNAAVLVGPDRLIASYRKIHLPFLGIDRFTTPGDRPFAVHEIDGAMIQAPGLGSLRVGMTICYDGSFPEAARCLMLQGADLVVLPTNWPQGARVTVRHLVQARALENQIFYATVNRIGEERGFEFIGNSRIVDVNGDLLAVTEEDDETILYAEIDPARARAKRIVKIPGQYELDRIAHRRPDMYGPIVKPLEE